MSAARLDGRVVVVTGAGRGIGAATGRLLKARGASVIGADLEERHGRLDGWSTTPAQRTARDSAQVIAFLLSDESAYINGADLPVDGGHVAHGGVKAISDALKPTA